MKLIVESPVGSILTHNFLATTAHVHETVIDDCYRLRDIAKVWTPRSMFDIGTAAGEVSMFAKSLWPSIQIVGFEENADWFEDAESNIGGMMVEKANVGYGLIGPSLVWKYGLPDLMKIDCEGGEVPLFYDLHRHNQIGGLRVIVGEWHGWAAKNLLQFVLSELFDTLFIDPPPGCGPWHNFYAVRKDVGLEVVRDALLNKRG